MEKNKLIIGIIAVVVLVVGGVAVFHLMQPEKPVGNDVVDPIDPRVEEIGAPRVTISASPNPVVHGRTTTITWSSTNVTICTGTNFSTGMGSPTSGVVQSAALTAATTLIVSCTGEGGNVTASVTVEAIKRVFITSTIHTGNLGGLTGADSICQIRANAAGLGGTWRAWLSDTRKNARDRIKKHNVPITLVDTLKRVANNFIDLTDGILIRKINLTELGTEVASVRNMWTNTNSEGYRKDMTESLTCDNWSTESSLYGGHTGRHDRTDSEWTEYWYESCDRDGRLYCMEQ